MDFGWGGAGPLSPNSGGADLNLLGDNLLIDVDDKTLQCLMGGPSTGFAACMSGLPVETASGSGKRPLEGEGEIVAELDDEDNDSEDGGVGTGRRGRDCARGGKKARRPSSDAATIKAHREKARRERLNECFEELARLCDPSGKMTRTDRISIVQDAIRALGAVRVENNQLRQLNKFLEERVRHLETARAQDMYQHVMMTQQQQMVLGQQQQQQQHVQQQQPQALQPGEGSQTVAAAASAPSIAAAASAAPGPEIQPVAEGSGSLDAPQLGQMQASTAAGLAALPQQQQQQEQHAAVVSMVPPGMMLVPMTTAAGPATEPSAYAHPFYGMKAEAMDPSPAPSGNGGVAYMGRPTGGTTSIAGFMMPAATAIPSGMAASMVVGVPQAAAMQQQAAPPQMLPANAPSMSWLPAPDISQDQKLRPPAA